MHAILKFFASLLPNFERNQILEDIDLLRKDVTENLLPAYQAAARDMRGKGFKAAVVNKFNDMFVHLFPAVRRVGFVDGMVLFFQPMHENLNLMETYVQELFAKDVTKDAITYRKLNVIKYLEMVRFINKYAGRALLRVLAAETTAINGGTIDGQLSPMELRWLTENQSAYFQALQALWRTPAHLKEAFEDIPDIVVIPERAEMVRQTIGADKLDPLKMGFINFSLDAGINPIYHFRMVVAEAQVADYKRKVEEKRTLELRLLALKEAYEGKQDAKLAQQIEYSEGRLQKLNYNIDKLTAEYS